MDSVEFLSTAATKRSHGPRSAFRIGPRCRKDVFFSETTMLDFDYAKTIGKMCEVINEGRTIAESMSALLDFCESEAANDSKLWKELRRRNYADSAWKFQQAFGALLQSMPVPAKYTGLYFGLDALNMEKSKGIEFGCSKTFDEANDDGGVKWAYNSEFYPFEIPSELHRELYNGVVEMAGLADHAVCIAYTGLAIRDALTELPRNLILEGAKSRAVCFGPHDGDLYRLGTLRADGLHVHCR